MRKICTTICFVFLLWNMAQSQQLRTVVASQAKAQPLKALNALQNAEFETSHARTYTEQVQTEEQDELGIDAVTVTSTQIGASENVNTFIFDVQRQIFALPNVGTNGGSVGFIFRKKATNCGGSSGSLYYNLSNDGGSSWVSTSATGCVGAGPLNPDLQSFARYPEQLLFGSSVNDLKMLYGAPTIPTTAGSSWVGEAMFGLAKDLNSVNGPIVTQEDYYTSNVANIYRPSNIVQRGNTAEFWMIIPKAQPQAGMSELDVWKGLYNPSSEQVNWNIVQTLSFANFANQLNGFLLFNTVLTFSPSGNVGYISMLGDLIGGKDSTIVPILMEFDAANQTFGDPYELISSMSDAGVTPSNMDLYDSLTSYVKTFVDSNNVPISPNIMFTSLDASVDAKGNLHLLSAVLPGPAPDDAPYTFYPSFGGRVVHLTQNVPTKWNAEVVSPLHKYREVMGTGANILEIDAFPYISTSWDRDLLFFHWRDSDTSIVPSASTTGFPNLIGCVYDVNEMQLSDTVNWTKTDPSWGGLIYQPKTPTYALQANATSCEFQIPVVNLYISNTTQPNVNAVDFFYFSDIHYCKDDAVTPVTWVLNHSVGIKDVSEKLKCKLFPNPASKSVELQVSLPQFAEVQVEIMSSNGQVLKKAQLSGAGQMHTSFDLQGLTKGIYLVKITSPKGIATEKLMIE